MVGFILAQAANVPTSRMIIDKLRPLRAGGMCVTPVPAGARHCGGRREIAWLTAPQGVDGDCAACQVRRGEAKVLPTAAESNTQYSVL